MAYEESTAAPREREMVQGNWKCSKCEAAISELPFQPDESRLGELKCRDCHMEGRRERFGGNRGGFRDRGERQMVEGNWTCSNCGNAITKLPFNPDPSRLGELKCSDCHRESRQNSRRY
jgi:DNA-directed RNA polymerase subunit RPC12/RpoP